MHLTDTDRTEMNNIATMSMIIPFPIRTLYFPLDISALAQCIFLLTFIFVKLRTHEKIVQVSLEKFYGIILQTHLLPQENKFGHNIFTLKILDGKHMVIENAA